MNVGGRPLVWWPWFTAMPWVLFVGLQIGLGLVFGDWPVYAVTSVLGVALVVVSLWLTRSQRLYYRRGYVHGFLDAHQMATEALSGRIPAALLASQTRPDGSLIPEPWEPTGYTTMDIRAQLRHLHGEDHQHG